VTDRKRERERETLKRQRDPLLKIDVTARCNELLCYRRTSFTGRGVERCGAILCRRFTLQRASMSCAEADACPSLAAECSGVRSCFSAAFWKLIKDSERDADKSVLTVAESGSQTCGHRKDVCQPVVYHTYLVV